MIFLSPIFLSIIFLSMATYPGGKLGAGTFQRIISQIPPHHLYVEPFVGGGAILLKKRPAAESRAYDLEPGAIAALRERVPENTRLHVADGLQVLEATIFEPDTFIYADPPYLQQAVLSCDISTSYPPVIIVGC